MAIYTGICIICNVEYTRKVPLVGKTCSRKCGGVLKSRNHPWYEFVELVCRGCGKEFKRTRFAIFCSVDCRKKHHLSTTKNRKTFLASSCELCGWDDEPGILQFHHKNRNRDDNTHDNVIVLCPNCHFLDHFKKRDGFFSPADVKLRGKTIKVHRSLYPSYP
jgi:hypothetical protein